MVEEGIDDEALLAGLYVVGEDSEFGCLELGDVVVIACQLTYQRIGSVHYCLLLLYFPDKQNIVL